MFSSNTTRDWLLLFAIFALTYLIFTVLPEIDIWISSIFYSQVSGFWLDQIYGLQLLRKIILLLVNGLFIFALIFYLASFIHKQYFGIPRQVWLFITFIYILGPLILVNGVLKSTIGRARPSDILEFGGEKIFTPVFEFTDQCETNCSFVSGEGSSAAAFYLSILILIRYLPFNNFIRLLHWLAFGIAILGLGLRVVKGRHFLSDSLFAVLFIIIIACLIHPIILAKKIDQTESKV